MEPQAGLSFFKAIVLFLVLLALVGAIVTIARSPRARAIFLGILAALIPVGVIALMFGWLYLSVGERREDATRAERARVQAVREESSSMVRSRTSDGEERIVVPRGETWRATDGDGSVEVETIDAGGSAEDAPPARRPNAEVVLEVPDDRARWERDSVLDFQATQEEPSWVENAAGSRYRAAYAGDTDFIYWEPILGKLVAYGEKEATRDRALESARAVAARKLAALALLRLKREKRDLEVRKVHPLAERLARERASRFITETFVEKAHVTYANAEVHRAALLVDAADASVRTLATDIGQELRRGWLAEVERSRRVLFGVVVAILLGFGVFLVYGLLNASTKGHFAWPLRIASVSLLVLLLVAVYYFRTGLA